MLRSVKDLEGYTACATDGDAWKVVHFLLLLDDERWIVRHLVVEPGTFLDGIQVLISPISFREVEWGTRSKRGLPRLPRSPATFTCAALDYGRPVPRPAS